MYSVLLIEGGKTEDSRNQDSNFPMVLPIFQNLPHSIEKNMTF